MELWMAVEMLATWCVRKLRGGRAALAVSRVVSGAGEARLAREEVCINMNKCSVY